MFGFISKKKQSQIINDLKLKHEEQRKEDKEKIRLLRHTNKALLGKSLNLYALAREMTQYNALHETLRLGSKLLTSPLGGAASDLIKLQTTYKRHLQVLIDLKNEKEYIALQHSYMRERIDNALK